MNTYGQRSVIGEGTTSAGKILESTEPAGRVGFIL